MQEVVDMLESYKAGKLGCLVNRCHVVRGTASEVLSKLADYPVVMGMAVIVHVQCLQQAVPEVEKEEHLPSEQQQACRHPWLSQKGRAAFVKALLLVVGTTTNAHLFEPVREPGLQR
jgi:hypothetical protein